MRIFHIIAGGRFGGAETFFLDLVEALSHRSLCQHAFTRPFPERLARLDQSECTTTTARMGGPLDFFSKHKLTRSLQTTAPDVALSWMSRAAHLAQPGPWVNVGRLGGYYDLKYYSSCDYLICNTPNIVQHCIDHGWPSEKVDYIPNFSPSVECTPIGKASLFTPEDAPVLLVLARLEDSKGVDVALRAVQDVPGAYLWIAGTGSKDGALRSWSKSLGIDDRVRFLGWRTDREALLKSADICLVPSRQEPFGNVIVNAWTNGVPVVAAACAGPSFLIENETNGLLVPIDDSQALANAVQRLLSDRSLTERLTLGGGKLAEGPFSKNVVVDAYCGLFDRLVKPTD